MDIVYIRGLEIRTVIGIFDWERKIRQPVTIDLEMASDIKKAAATESIEHALNYKAVVDRLTSFVEASDFQLIETMAEEIAHIVQNEFGVCWLRLDLGKPEAIEGSTKVGVIIERGERVPGESR